MASHEAVLRAYWLKHAPQLDAPLALEPESPCLPEQSLGGALVWLDESFALYDSEFHDHAAESEELWRLRWRVETLTRRVAELEAERRRVDALERRLDELEADGGYGEVLADDSFETWIRQHDDELRKHAGKRVAIHLHRGIVAVGLTYGEVFRQVKELELVDDTLIYAVPTD